MDPTEQLLKDLSEATGVAGFETEVRAVMRRYLGNVGPLEQDKLGSVICRKAGTSDRPRVLVSGHMDEIGLMVKQITKEGCIRFIPLGGWWAHVLGAQPVVIKTIKGDVFGIIGMPPPHGLTAEARGKVVELRDMYIDIGATSAEQAKEAGVRPGDVIVPVSAFRPMLGKTVLGKAWDCRAGCAVVVEAMQRLVSTSHPNTVFGIGTVQEEVGLRGAVTSTHMVDPDVAIVIEGGGAADVPGLSDQSPLGLGKGPILLLFEPGMIANVKLRDLAIRTAEGNSIPLQITMMEPGTGSTDAAKVHMHHAGVPTLLLAVPARHIHSHAGILHRDDVENTVKLVLAMIAKLDEATVRGLTE